MPRFEFEPCPWFWLNKLLYDTVFLLIAVLHLISEVFFNAVVDFDEVRPEVGRQIELFIAKGFIVDFVDYLSL